MRRPYTLVRIRGKQPSSFAVLFCIGEHRPVQSSDAESRAGSTFQFGRLFGRVKGFVCLLVRLARWSLRNRVFAEGAGGHVTPDTSWLANMHILSAATLSRSDNAHCPYQLFVLSLLLSVCLILLLSPSPFRNLMRLSLSLMGTRF